MPIYYLRVKRVKNKTHSNAKFLKEWYKLMGWDKKELKKLPCTDKGKHYLK